MKGLLKPSKDRLTIGSTILILHAHPPGDTCSACESTSIKAELPETLQYGILSGQEQKEFLEKAEAERIREFYNFDKYCWGPGMCKAAQEQVKFDQWIHGPPSSGAFRSKLVRDFQN